MNASATPAVVRVFVSSTWLDLQPERTAVEHLLQRFREAKFVGMEYFGSRDETTRAASLAEVGQSDLYVGIIGGRYGSGITEAEYDAARSSGLACFVYFKQDATIPDDAHDKESEKRDGLARFKAKLADPDTGHIVSQFAGAFELASLVAADLHNWLFERYLSPALASAAAGELGAEQTRTLRADLAGYTTLSRELLERVSAERRRSEEELRVAMDAFYELTYDVPKLLEDFPETAAVREGIVRRTVTSLERLASVNPDDDRVLRELATNWRLLAKISADRQDWSAALTAFQKSGDYCATLVHVRPLDALYQRDYAVSHSNAGWVLEQMGRRDAARREYQTALPAARRAAELDASWADLVRDIDARLSV
jgi:tetratricopeptide (TPR) repeat protein